MWKFENGFGSNSDTVLNSEYSNENQFFVRLIAVRTVCLLDAGFSLFSFPEQNLQKEAEIRIPEP